MEKLSFYSDMIREQIINIFNELTQDDIDKYDQLSSKTNNTDNDELTDDQVLKKLYNILIKKNDKGELTKKNICFIGILAADFYERNKIYYDMNRSYVYENKIIEWLEKDKNTFEKYIQRFQKSYTFACDLIDQFIDYNDECKENKEMNRLYIKAIKKDYILKRYNKLYLLDEITIEYDKFKKQKKKTLL
jgi:hypothetical protein